MKPFSGYIQPNWSAPSAVRAYCTTRIAPQGRSIPPYDSFNIAMHVGDSAAHVEHNRAVLKKQLSLPSEPCWLHQVHSTEVIHVEEHLGSAAPTADAAVAHSTGLVCVVMTADCLPILIARSDGKQVAAVHAGWRGLLDGIIEATAKRLQAADNTSWLAWIGPAIGPCHFAVGPEVRDSFIAKNPAHHSCFKQMSSQWHGDLFQMATQTLKSSLASVTVYSEHQCTVCDSEQFYSYRREQQTGRLASLIWISDQS